MSTSQTTRSRGRVALGMGLAAGLVVAITAVASSADAATTTTTQETLWGSGTPAGVGVEVSDTAAVELGTTFTAKADGDVVGVRYWKTKENVGTHTGSLWSSTGTRLATATFTNESTSGWQTVTFSAPVDVVKGKSYVVSYFAPQGKYAFTSNFRGSSVAPSLSVPSSNAGKYTYGSKSAFPKSTYQSTNYWVDAVFVADSAPTTAPTTTAPQPVETPKPTPTPTQSPKPTPTPTQSPTPAPTTPPTTAPSGKPGPTTTGVPAGTTLKPSGGLTITQANQVIDGLDISGAVTVQASGVVIKNSKIHGNGSGNGVFVRSGSVTIVDSEIYGFENGIGFDNWTATRVNVHSTTGDGVKLGSNTTLQDSWIHDLTPASGAHADGMQVQSGVRNLVVRNNVIDLSTTKNANAALFMAPDLGPSTPGPALFEGNYFNGGNYTVYCVDGNNGQYFIDNITFRNNTFGRTAQYGPTRINVPVTWTGNTYADNGAKV